MKSEDGDAFLGCLFIILIGLIGAPILLIFIGICRFLVHFAFG